MAGALWGAGLLISPSVQGQEGQPAADSPLVVMAVDSMRDVPSDGHADQAAPMGRAVHVLAERLNAQGGLLGRRIDVIQANDQCDGDVAAGIAERAVALRAHTVIGHACASGAIRAAAIYAQGGLMMIATGPRHPRLTAPQARPGIFRLGGREDRQAESMVQLLVRSFSGARVAIVHDRSLQGRGMAEELHRSAAAAKVSPVAVVTYAAGSKDYGAVVRQLMAAKADLLIFPGQPLEASIILAQAAEAGAGVRTVIGTDVLAAEVPPARLLAAVETFLVMLPWPGVERGETRVPDDQAAMAARKLAETAFEMWVGAVAAAGSPERLRVAEALTSPVRTTHFDAISFDQNGDAAVPSFIPHVWHQGAWRTWPR